MMKTFKSYLLTLFSVAILFISQSNRAYAEDFNPAKAAGLHGGLIVQLGATDAKAATQLSLTGRYLIHILDADAEKVQAARTKIRKEGYYGLAWAEKTVSSTKLPYAENLVNLIVVQDYAVPVKELFRVLTPGGSIVVTNAKLLNQEALTSAGFNAFKQVDSTLVAKKPWPAEMDTWSHPRHAADGNAVSADTLVGPPERVRWVAAATTEVEGMVTAGGRNFYGGILARDSFNGLRLWHRNLRQTENNPEVFKLPRLSRNGARPIASSELLFAVLKKEAVALNAATGEIVVKLGDLKNPTSLLHKGNQVIATDADSIRAFDTKTGKQNWIVKVADPRTVVSDGNVVAFLKGRIRRGDKPVAVALDAKTGTEKWTRDDYSWLPRASRLVLAKGQLVFEVSTFNNDDATNGIHIVSAETGKHSWSKNYPPGMNHARQARALFVEDDLWILHGGKINTSDKSKLKRMPVQVSALDPLTGKVRITHPAGMTHCFPPVATPNFMFAGELDMTNLKSGKVIANRITKANCSRENGWVPANGLVYTTPKHCTCWPMLRGFVAMAPALKKDSPVNLPTEKIDFLLIKGTAKPDPNAAKPKPEDWPLYRHDRWRSGSTKSKGPKLLNKKWTLTLGNANDAKAKPTGPILHDWKDNPIIKGQLSAPTIANGIVYVTKPNEHELIAINSTSGKVTWRFTANGRLDTPPAIYKGLCLFGSATGWVYALKANTGELVWKLRAAPTEERIVTYGQVESPWPVPGAILVMDDIAYFAAGRQPLADGGILVFAVNPMTGERHWVKRINSLPQKGFYENSGLEFDPFDILHAEGKNIAMSRWIISNDGKKVDVNKWNAFAKLNTGAGEVWIPRGSWTYGARHQHRFKGEASRRPLISFRDDNIYSSLNGSTNIFRRDFNLEKGEKFDSKWITGWQAVKETRTDGKPYRTYRIAKGAKWKKDPFADPKKKPEKVKRGTQLFNEVHAMALAGDDQLFVIHKDGRLKVLSTFDGYVVRETKVAPPAWDGLAIAEKKLFLTTKDGKLTCLGE